MVYQFSDGVRFRSGVRQRRRTRGCFNLFYFWVIIWHSIIAAVSNLYVLCIPEEVRSVEPLLVSDKLGAIQSTRNMICRVIR